MQFVLRDQSPVQIRIQRVDQMMDESRTIHIRLPVTRRLYGHLPSVLSWFILTFSPCAHRSILPQSASSRNLCLRTITSPTRPCCTGSRPRVGPGTWGWTRRVESWRETTWRRTSLQHTSFPNHSKVSSTRRVKREKSYWNIFTQPDFATLQSRQKSN